MLSFFHSKLWDFSPTNLPAPGTKPTPSVSSSRREHRPIICDHRLITNHPTPLKFHAAAYLQLQFFPPPSSTEDDDWTVLLTQDLLIASPYNHPSHLLDLSTLETPYQLFAKALTAFKPIQPDYATASYSSSFNWQAVVELLEDFAAAEDYEWKELRFHVVIFRSKLHLNSKRRSELSQLDQNAHKEAIKGGGLLKYWFGDADKEGQNLATCECNFRFLRSNIVANNCRHLAQQGRFQTREHRNGPRCCHASGQGDLRGDQLQDRESQDRTWGEGLGV